MNRTIPPYVVPPITPEYGGLKDRYEALRQYFVQLFLPSLSNYLTTLSSIVSTGTQGVGAALTAASTIKISAYIHHIAGTATISTIAIPGDTTSSRQAGTQLNFQAPVVLISNDGFNLTTGGNIAKALAVPVNECAFLVYDGFLWYPLAFDISGGTGGTSKMEMDVNIGSGDGHTTVFPPPVIPARDANNKPQAVLYRGASADLYDVNDPPEPGRWHLRANGDVVMGIAPAVGEYFAFIWVVTA